MSDVKAARRSYDAPVRRARAHESRERTLRRARELFADKGYAATSMEDIARAAGVGRRSVYEAFGSKRGVLLALLAGIAPKEEARFEADLRDAAGDAELQLSLAVRFMATLYERAADLLEMVHAAGGADPDLAALDREGERRRRDNQHDTVRDWHRRGLLRTGLDPERAADIFWAMSSPHLFRMLVSDRGWTPEDYRDWLEGQLRGELLSRA
jgi:AcrR family transcriptional regulator